MGQVIQTNGDYNIKCRTNIQGKPPTIRLDAGSDGKVLIKGDLIVDGGSTEVSVEDLAVKDNIIVVNKGETGAGVTLRYAGIKVDRGTDPNVGLIWDEDINSWTFVSTVGPDTFTISDLSRLTLQELRTDPAAFNGDLFINIGPQSIVRLPDGISYETRVTEPFHIPNKKYVDDAIQNQPTFQLRVDDTRVYVVDKDIAGSELAYTQQGFPPLPASENAGVMVIVDGLITSQFFQNRATIRGLEISDNKITTNQSYPGINENVIIETRGNGRLQTNIAVQYQHRVTPPAPVTGSTLVYGANPNIGSSGVWFTNTNTGADSINNNGELISKNRALVFSMLF